MVGEEKSDIQDDDGKDQSPAEQNDGLVNWANPPKVSDLKSELLEAKPHHEAQKTKIAAWLDNLNVRGQAIVRTPEGSSKIIPKTIRKHAEWRYAALSEPFLSTENLFTTKPKTAEDVEAARQNGMLLNYQWNTFVDKVSFIDEYVRTGVDEGTIIVRTGWTFREETKTENVPQYQYVVDPTFVDMHQELARMKLDNPSLYLTDVPDELKTAHDMYNESGGDPYKPMLVGYAEEEVTKTVANHPTVEICDYRNVLLDPTCYGDIDKATFLIYRFETSMSDLKKDGKYKNLDKVNVSANTPLNEPDHPSATTTTGFNFEDEARKRIIVHEYWGFWDIHNTGETVPIVAAWIGDTLIRLEENPYPDQKIPFVVVQYLPVRKNNYGEPDGVLIEDNQKIIGALTRGMIDLMGKSANGQTGMRKDMLDAANLKRFEQGKNYQFNPNVDPRQGVHTHTFPEIPVSAQFLLQQQNLEAESLTGVKSFNEGLTSGSLGEVAAGIKGVLDASTKREVGILRRLKAGIIKIARKFTAMNAEFLSDEEVVRVTNEEFVTVRRDDLAGHFDIEISISTAEEDAAKAQQMAFMLQTLGPNEDPAVRRMIMAEIFDLQKMPRAAKAIREYQPEPDPMQQQLAQLQMELLQAQIENERAKGFQAQTTGVLNQAKVGTEQAKAENLSADTDLKALDFVEEESGTKHEREKELHQAQAQAQTQTKIVEGHFREKEHNFKMQEKKLDLLKQYISDKKKKAA